MPGIAIIGDSRNAARNRPTSLPAEPRSLSRMLRLLKSPETASKALLESLSSLPLPADPGQSAALRLVQRQVSLAIEDMKEAGWSSFSDRYPEYNMALAVESVLQEPSSFQNEGLCYRPSVSSPAASLRSVGDSISTDSSNIIPTNTRDKHRGYSSHSVSSMETQEQEALQSTKTPNTVRRTAAAVVSDSSSVEEDSVTAASETQQITTTAQVDDHKVDELQAAKSARHIWALILESVHLQVASRTTKVWGRKKIYEVYQLARPVQDLVAKEEPLIRKRLEVESRSVLDGILLDSGYCRLYTTLQPLAGCDPSIQALHVQINLGKVFDLQDESNRGPSGEKKKKNEGEFVAILVPGSSLFALTASRAASRSRYTPYVLALLENVLTETTNTCAAMKATKKTDFDASDIAAKRFEDLSGTEPHELLRSARAAAGGEAVGRFAFMASRDQSNPVNDLRVAAAGNLLRPADPASAKNGELGNTKVARAAVQVELESEGTATVVAASRASEHLWLDHSVQEKGSRKRSCEEALGRSKDAPKLQRLCWKWSGETTAASTCWMDDDEATKPLNALPTTEFKCAVVMKGKNVLQGVQALVEAGLMDANLPDFIRDAPSLGGTIRIDHGSFVQNDAMFEGA